MRRLGHVEPHLDEDDDVGVFDSSTMRLIVGDSRVASSTMCRAESDRGRTCCVLAGGNAGFADATRESMNAESMSVSFAA